MRKIDGNNVLMQIITPETKAIDWGYTLNPTTNFGDDRWYNYSVLADVLLIESNSPKENYVGIGLKYNLASARINDYWIQLYENGKWYLKNSNTVLSEGVLSDFDGSIWHNLKIQAVDNHVKVWIDKKECVALDSEKNCSADRIALFSSWNQNCYDNILAETVEDTEPYIKRYDNTDLEFSYVGNWSHDNMSSFSNYNRTISEGTENAVMTFKFSGTGFALTGKTEQAEIMVKIDDVTVEEKYLVSDIDNRAVTYSLSGLENRKHTVEVTVISGKFAVDSLNVNLSDT